MYIDISLVLGAGMAVFAGAAIYFLFNTKKDFNSAFLVSFITLISYVLMYEGTLATAAPNGEAVYPTRWAFYALSCTLLMYEIARRLGKTMAETTFLLYLTAIVMLTGAAAAYYDGWYMYIFFALSTVAYLRLIYPLLVANSPHRSGIAKYILLGWTGFPVVFLLAPDGLGMITAGSAAAMFLAFDVFTKVAFYVDLEGRAINVAVSKKKTLTTKKKG